MPSSTRTHATHARAELGLTGTKLGCGEVGEQGTHTRLHRHMSARMQGEMQGGT